MKRYHLNEEEVKCTMIRKNQSIFNTFNMLSDGVLTFLSYILAVEFRFTLLDGRISIHMYNSAFVAVMLVYSAVMVLGYYLLHLYSPQRFSRVGWNNLRILSANAVGALMLMAAMYIVRVIDISRLAVIVFWFLSSMFVIIKHTVLHMLLRHYRARGYNQKHFVLVGNGKLAHQYLEDSRNNPYLGICVDGYVSAVERPELGCCLGSYEQLGEILENHEYDGLIVALEPHETQYMKHVLAAADKEGIDVKLIPFFNEYYPAYPTIDRVGRTKLINLRATPLDSTGNAMIKRAMDIAGSIALILLTSPVMLTVAIGVKLSSPGPVFFVQERIGKDKKPFYMHKFRSMRVDIDHEGWSTDYDPRKTRFGSMIRKYSLDELPQLFDVLIGNMSLVGPRPEIPRFVRQFKEEIPLYLVRQQVRPGMTGWAQIHGLRGDTSIEERVQYDIWYIENWSVLLDIRILFKTAFGGMKNSELIGVKKDAA